MKLTTKPMARIVEVAVERRAILHELETARGEHRRHGEHEGELDDRALGHAEERSADDRRRGARHARDDGDGLEQADEERLAIGDLGEVDVAVVALLEALEDDERDAADEQRR